MFGAFCLHHDADCGVVITACWFGPGSPYLVVTMEAQIEVGQVCMILNQSTASEKWSQLADCLDVHEARHLTLLT